MTDQWYYRQFGTDVGPMSLAKLKELADGGTILALDYVRSASSNEWVAAATIAELGLTTSQRRTAAAMDATSTTSHDVSTAPLANSDWYCRLGGQELGPLSFDEILTWAENQQLSAEDEVKLGSSGRWRRVDTIGRLVAALPYRPIEKIIGSAGPTPVNGPKVEPATNQKLNQRAVRTTVPCENATGRGVPDVTKVRTTGSTNTASPMLTVPGQPRTGSDPQVATVVPVAVVPVAVDTQLSAPKHEDEQRGTSPRLPSPSISSYGQSHSSALPASSGARPTMKPRPLPVRPTARQSSWLSGIGEVVKNPQAIGSICAIALVMLILGWGYLPKSRGADIKRYHALKQIFNEIRAKRTSAPAELAMLKQKLEQTASQIVSEVKAKAGRDDPAKQCLLWAARDETPRFIQAGLAAESIAEKCLEAKLQDVAYELGLEQRPVVTLAQSTSPEDDH